MLGGLKDIRPVPHDMIHIIYIYIYIIYILYILYIYIYTVYTFGETKPSHLHLPEWADTSKYPWISEVRAPKKDMDATTTIRDSNI